MLVNTAITILINVMTTVFPLSISPKQQSLYLHTVDAKAKENVFKAVNGIVNCYKEIFLKVSPLKVKWNNIE
jgi:hypothetical protein